MKSNFRRSRSPLITHHPLRTPSIEEDMAYPAAGGGRGRSAALESNFSRASNDVVFYVGKHRQAYHVNLETLIRSSAYFRNLLDVAPHKSGCPARAPIAIDCEEGIFESLLLLMRYGTLEALPPMSAAEIFRLKKEADFYGIQYTEPHPSMRETSHSDDGSSDLSCLSPSSSSPSGSPRSMMNMSPPAAGGKRASRGRYYEGIHLAGSTPRQFAELRELPLLLADPARLVLVSCLDQERASIYACDCVAISRRRSATQWAINFHHRHAFCTACGRTPNLSPKYFAEMFRAAAAHYHAAANPAPAGPMEPKGAWRVSSDSTCTLRFIRSDACGCSGRGARAAKEARPTIWAANSFYGHAFCTSCGEVAGGPVLLGLTLALRYGGRSMKVSGSARSMDSQPGSQSNGP